VGHALRQGDVGGLYDFNVETLTADKTLTVRTDPIYQYLNPGDANRIVTLSTTGAKAGDRFIIRHNGPYNSTYYLDVQQAGVSLDWVYAGVVKEFVFDGSNWVSRGIGTGENDTKRYQVGIGYRANPYTYGTAVGSYADGSTFGVAVGYGAYSATDGVAVGYGALGSSFGVAVGYGAEGTTWGTAVGRCADGTTYGVAVGLYAVGSTYGVAVGRNAITGGKRYSIAIGHYSRCTRTSETAVNIDGNSSYLRQATQGRWYGRTTDATATEIFCGGISGERFTIRAKSAVAFKGLIVASTEAVAGTPNVTSAWKVEGLIKRDADGVTSMVDVTVTLIARDAGAAAWSVTVDADDVNEALRITVRGAVATTIDWAARMDCVEVVW